MRVKPAVNIIQVVSSSLATVTQWLLVIVCNSAMLSLDHLKYRISYMIIGSENYLYATLQSTILLLVFLFLSASTRLKQALALIKLPRVCCLEKP